MTTKTLVKNDGPGLVLVKVMYQVQKPSAPMTSGRNGVDYSVEEKYIVAGESREFNIHAYQYLLVEEVHP